jgi:hypothetical protein
MRECAYLFWGTSHPEIIKLAHNRIKRILILRVTVERMGMTEELAEFLPIE